MRRGKRTYAFAVSTDVHFADLVNAYRHGWAGWGGEHCEVLAAMRAYADEHGLSLPDIKCPDCSPSSVVLVG